MFYSHALNLCRIQIFMFHVYFFLCKNASKNIQKGHKVGVVVKVINQKIIDKDSATDCACAAKMWFCILLYILHNFGCIVLIFTKTNYIFVFI